MLLLLSQCSLVNSYKKDTKSEIELIFLDYSSIIMLLYLILPPVYSWDWMWMFSILKYSLLILIQ